MVAKLYLIDICVGVTKYILYSVKKCLFSLHTVYCSNTHTVSVFALPLYQWVPHPIFQKAHVTVPVRTSSLVSSCFFPPQSPPNHVIPGPEELYIYSPLGTAFKVTGSDPSSKNPSIITM